VQGPTRSAGSYWASADDIEDPGLVPIKSDQITFFPQACTIAVLVEKTDRQGAYDLRQTMMPDERVEAWRSSSLRVLFAKQRVRSLLHGIGQIAAIMTSGSLVPCW